MRYDISLLSNTIYYLTHLGNEGDIEAFAQNTGFMWDIAEEFHAMLVRKN